MPRLWLATYHTQRKVGGAGSRHEMVILSASKQGAEVLWHEHVVALHGDAAAGGVTLVNVEPIDGPVSVVR